MKTKLILGALAAVAAAQAHAQTRYAISMMPPDKQLHTTSVAIESSGRVLTANTGLADSRIEFGALCSVNTCKRNSPVKRQGHWLGLGPDQGLAGQALYEDGKVYWAIYRPAGGGQIQRITTGAAWSINATNQVVGETGYSTPFTFKDGALVILPTLGGAHGAAHAVNDGGFIVGESQGVDGKTRATAWVNGVATELGVHPNGGDTSSAMAVNESGVSVGCANRELQSFQQAARFDGGVAKILGPGHLGSDAASGACAMAINDSGVIVGWSQALPLPDTRAFVMEGDAMIDLNTRLHPTDQVTYKLLSATGINRKGQISVTALRWDGYVVALRLDPDGWSQTRQ